MNRLLITQQELANYGGSEVVTLELSNYFLSIGFEVTILTNYFGLPISKEFDQRVKIVDTNTRLNMHKYSHVWIHHNLIPMQLLEILRPVEQPLPRIAFHHMSPYIPIEAPLVPELEDAIADTIYFNSPETMRAYEAFFKNKKKLSVLGNPAPESFSMNARDRKARGYLQKILVVSNHAPKELEEALSILASKGIKIEKLGLSGRPELVTPERLDEYDVVVSIGKTVQYSLVRGIPVYCYDHFGGSGYLSPRNFERNRDLNFSGRGFHRKKPELIAEEILKKYQRAVEDILVLRAEYGSEFTLPASLSSYISGASRDRRVLEVGLETIEKQKTLMSLSVASIQSIVHLRNALSDERNKAKQYLDEIEKISTKNATLTRKLHSTVEYKLLRILKLLGIVR